MTKLPQEYRKEVGDAVSLAVKTVKDNPKMRKKKIPAAVLNSLGYAMLLPLGKFVSTLGVRGSGLHSSVLRKMTKRELVSYIGLWGGAYTLVLIVIQVYVLTFMFLGATYGLGMKVTKSDVKEAIKEVALFNAIFHLSFVSVKRSFGKYVPEKAKKLNKKELANEAIRKNMQTRAEYIPTRADKAVKFTFRASLLLGGAGGIVLLYKTMICELVKLSELPCTCSGLQEYIAQVEWRLSLDEEALRKEAGEAYSPNLRKQLKQMLKLARHGLIMKRCGPAERMAACGVMQSLTGMGMTECLTMSCDELGSVYREFSKKYHPDKGGSKEKFGQLTTAKKTLERGCPRA